MGEPPRKGSRRLRGLAVSIVLLVVAVPAGSASANTYLRTRDFNHDPAWEAAGARPDVPACNTVATRFRRRAGELGVLVRRSLEYHAYGRLLTRPVSLDVPFGASFKLRMADDPGDASDHRNAGIALIGFFNSRASRDWRTPQSAALRLNLESHGVDVRFEYGTTSYRAGGDAYRDPAGRPVRLEPNRTYEVRLEYDPAAGEGAGELRLAIAGVGLLGRVPLRPGHRQDGAVLDRFGVWNAQVPSGDDAASPHLDDVRIDGEAVDDFSGGAPGWGPSGAMGRSFVDCRTDDRHDLGWDAAAGRVGGLVWRTDERDPSKRAYYADVLPEPLGLDDELYAEGDLTVTQASSDSAVLVGWFNHHANPDAAVPWLAPSTVAMKLTGPSSEGHFALPYFRAAALRAGRSEDWALPAFPQPARRRFAIHYLPGPPSADGTLSVTIDGVTRSLRVPPAAKEEGAVLDRFGIRNVQVGGHAITAYLDNVRYTFRPGGPAHHVDPPVNRATPRVTGEPAPGATLAVTAGIWDRPLDGIAHRWERCTADGRRCERLPFTGGSHVVRPEDRGWRLRVVEEVRSDYADAVVVSELTEPVGSSRTARIDGGHLRVPVVCPALTAPCSGRVRILTSGTGPPVVLGRARISLTGAARRVVTVRLDGMRRGRRCTSRPLRAASEVVVHGPGGTARSTRPLVILASRRACRRHPGTA